MTHRSSCKRISKGLGLQGPTSTQRPARRNRDPASDPAYDVMGETNPWRASFSTVPSQQQAAQPATGLAHILNKSEALGIGQKTGTDPVNSRDFATAITLFADTAEGRWEQQVSQLLLIKGIAAFFNKKHFRRQSPRSRGTKQTSHASQAAAFATTR